jgi:hypothetical protein
MYEPVSKGWVQMLGCKASKFSHSSFAISALHGQARNDNMVLRI